jgi:hypothetical protein
MGTKFVGEGVGVRAIAGTQGRGEKSKTAKEVAQERVAQGLELNASLRRNGHR